jgi:hypothetical protein
MYYTWNVGLQADTECLYLRTSEPRFIENTNFTAKFVGGDVAARPPPADHRKHCF